MITYQLSMFREGQGAPFQVSPVEPASFGSFAAGDFIFAVGQPFSVVRIAHTIIVSGKDTHHVTALILVPAPMQPHLVAETGGDLVPWPWLEAASKDRPQTTG